jgi:hypothetical protein
LRVEQDAYGVADAIGDGYVDGAISVEIADGG